MTFRQIDTDGFKPAELRDQAAPTLIWAEIATMVIDERYQRGLTVAGRRAIQAIANDWDWTKYQPILVAATADGRMAVVDGQHRAHAAKLAGLDAIPAMVVPMTPSEQAAAFAAVNTTRIKLNRAGVFKAKLAAGDPVAVEADRICREAGCRLMTYTPTASQRKPGDVFAHHLVMTMVSRGEGEAVSVGLRAVRESAVGSEAEADIYGFARRVYDAAILTPWLNAIASSQKFLRLPLADIFDQIEWDDLRDEATRYARLNGGSVRARMTDEIKVRLRLSLEKREAA